MRNKPRRYFTLLELIIGLSLTAILLFFLSSFFFQINWMSTQVDRKRNENFRTLYLKTRLTQVIPQIRGEYTDKSKKKHFYFFSDGSLNGLLAEQQPSLVFLYASGNDMDTKIAANALGRLYLDRQGRFSLASLPAPDTWADATAPIKPKIEVLMERVKTIRFLFYYPPERDRSKIITKSADTQTIALDPPYKDAWIHEWKREYQQLPPMLKIIVTTEDDRVHTFAFSLPRSNFLPVYES